MAVLAAAMAMPYPFAMPDEPGYGHPAPAYHDAPIGRVKIQVL